MNPRLRRALVLIEQGRHRQAEDELRQSLLVDPNSSMSHAALALCLSDREQYSEASHAAEAAIALAPDDPFSFYAQAVVYVRRNRFAEAEAAIRQAIDLAPERANQFAVLGEILLARQQWRPALEAAEQGLEVDPDDVDCSNVRAQALLRLRRKDAAQNVVMESLARDPENAETHANMGWTLIGRGQYEQAMKHFREALRLQPDLEWARVGIIEALKARRLIYRVVLQYFLWMQTLSSRARWGIIVGAYVGYMVLKRVASTNPELAPWIWPFLALYLIWVASTWMLGPLLNLTLLTDRFGRMALSREEKITGIGVGLCLLTAIVGAIMWLLTDVIEWVLLAVTGGFLIPPLSRIYDCQPGWPRVTMALITLGLLVLACGAIGFQLIAGDGEMRFHKMMRGLAILGMFAFLGGSFASQLAANALTSVLPKR